MKRVNARTGFILVMTLMMIALAMLMTSVMFDRGNTYVPYAQTIINRQKSIMLAYSGLAIVESQLLATENKTEKAAGEPNSPPKQPAKPTEEQEAQQLLRTILPHLNRWQTFNFTEEHDGIDAILKVCLMSEEGKLNINKIYDFKTKKFKDEAAQGGGFKTALTALCADLEKTIHAKDMFTALEQYLRKRDYLLNDVTELLTIKAFEPFKNNIYYQPPSDVKNKQKADPAYVKDSGGHGKGAPGASCALTDIFTTTSSDAAVQPWVLSESLRALLHIPPSPANVDPKQSEMLAETVKQFKLKNQWQKDWDTSLKTLYGVEYARLPKTHNAILRPSGSLRYFSVLIHSTVGDATQQLYVILERIKKSQDTKTVYQIVIRSYYWL
jgi:hypothetical protein